MANVARPELTSDIGVCASEYCAVLCIVLVFPVCSYMFLYGPVLVLALAHCCLRQMEGKYPPPPTLREFDIFIQIMDFQVGSQKKKSMI